MMKKYAINWMFANWCDGFLLHTNHIEGNTEKEVLNKFHNIFNVNEWINIKICAIGKNIK